MDIETLVRELKLDEGTGPMRNGRFLAYKDTVGVTTIGYGRNLDANGLRPKEAEFMLRNDIEDEVALLDKEFDWFKNLSQARKEVLVNMSFNMGLDTLKQFKTTLGLMARGLHEEAATQMLKSKWAEQVGRRARRLADKYAKG